MPAVIALIVGFTGLTLFTFLLREGRLSAGTYTWLILTTALAALAVYGFDRLRILDLRSARLVLDEVRSVREDVYAKADTVRRLGEEVAELVGFSIRRVGRWVGDDHSSQLIQAREQIAELLAHLDASEERTAEIIDPINDTIAFDLRNEVRGAIEREIYEYNQRGQQPPIDKEDVLRATTPHLKAYDRARLEGELTARGLHSDRVRLALERLDRFLQTRRL